MRSVLFYLGLRGNMPRSMEIWPYRISRGPMFERTQILCSSKDFVLTGIVKLGMSF